MYRNYFYYYVYWNMIHYIANPLFLKYYEEKRLKYNAPFSIQQPYDYKEKDLNKLY